MPTLAEPTFHFEGHTLDLRRGSLLRGDRDVELRPKSFALLRYLVENAGRLVSKDELIARLWPNVTVTDESLTRCVSDVRIALGDHGQRIIKTVPRRGYMFVAAVSVRATAAESQQAPSPLSLVVLPFVNLGGELHDHFADGLTDTLTTDLSHILDTSVIARDTAFTFTGKRIDARQIGRELDVRYVVEGSVQSAGDVVRVNVQLIDAETRTHLWALCFDKPRADPLVMQDEINCRIRRNLHLELVAAEGKRAAMKGDRASAAELAIQGWAARPPPRLLERIRKARRFFEAALRLDPENVSALMGLASSHQLEAHFWACEDPLGQSKLAEELSEKALMLAPRSAYAHFFCAEAYTLREPHRALRENELALSLDPHLSFAHARLGFAKILVGGAEEAEAHIAETFRLSPHDPELYGGYYYLGLADLHLGSFEQAVRRLRAATSLHPGLGLPWFHLAAAEVAIGRDPQAAEACAIGRRLLPHYSISKRRVLFSNNEDETFQTQHEQVCAAMRRAGVPE